MISFLTYQKQVLYDSFQQSLLSAKKKKIAGPKTNTFLKNTDNKIF